MCESLLFSMWLPCLRCRFGRQVWFKFYPMLRLHRRSFGEGAVLQYKSKLEIFRVIFRIMLNNNMLLKCLITDDEINAKAWPPSLEERE